MIRRQININLLKIETTLVVKETQNIFLYNNDVHGNLCYYVLGYVVFDELLFVVGGHGSSGDWLNSFEVFDPSNNIWTELPNFTASTKLWPRLCIANVPDVN